MSLLTEILNKPKREVEKVLARESTETARPDQIRVIANEVTRITIDVDAEFLELMNRVKELTGHAGSTPKELFKSAMKVVVQKKEVKIASQSKAKPLKKKSSLRPAEVDRPVAKKQTRFIPIAVRNEIRSKSNDQCEYVHHATQKRCSSKTALQFEHTVPHALGGKNTVRNLKRYCANHNRLAAIQVFGKQKIESYSRK